MARRGGQRRRAERDPAQHRLRLRLSGQQELLAPYLEKYLEAADTIWEAKGTQVATTVLEFMFPRALTSQETLDRVESWLETSPANPAAKRYVAEGRDDIVRALRAQAAAG